MKRATTIEVHQHAIDLRRLSQRLLSQPIVWSIDQKPWFMWNQRAMNPIMYTMSESVAVGIGFTRKTHYNIVVSGLSGVTNIVLNYLLIPVLEGKGAAIATGVSYMVFFWARTLISRKLWWKFPIDKYLIYTIIIIINCAVHTFITGYISYIVSAVSIVLVIVLNISEIKKLQESLKKAFKKE